MSASGLLAASCGNTLPQVIEVSSVTLSQSTAEMIEGETVQLFATVLPSDATDKTVIWASSKQSVATINASGVVTAVAEGESTITASAGGKTANCKVTVQKKTIEVASVTLDCTSVTLELGQATTLVATVLPDNAFDKTVSWTSSDPSVASVDASGQVCSLKKGSTTVTASAGGKSASCSVTVIDIQFGISPSEVDIPGAGGSFEVSVTCKGGYHVDPQSEWVTEKSVYGKVHTFTVSVNPDAEERIGVVVFCDDEGTCLPCKVRQAPGGNFSLSPLSVEIDAKGGSFTVKVASSLEYHISSMPSWISELFDQTRVQEHVFKVAENTGEDDRSGVIAFCDDKGTCLSCSVIQKGRVPDLAGGGSEDIPDGDPVKW